jgi:23S rRNA-/tRNA-specific pseudouridylate synthase
MHYFFCFKKVFFKIDRQIIDGCTIIGDDLYGKKATRLFLHADTLEFKHPTTKQQLIFHKKAEF